MKERMRPEDVGACKPDGKGGYAFDKEWHGQGCVFKSWEAYHERPNEPCYSPELSDAAYTAEDLLALCNGQKERADELFSLLDWQHPESEVEQLFADGEWAACAACGIVRIAGEDLKYCPSCGRELAF